MESEKNHTANDNDEPPVTTVTIGDLAAALGIDEEAVLQRIAGILSKRDTAALSLTAFRSIEDGE